MVGVGTPEIVAVNWVHTCGYAEVVRFGLISSRTVVKSPTSVAAVPTFVLVPLVLIRTWSLSGYTVPDGIRDQKVIVAPFCRVNVGVRSQLLIVPTLPVLL